MGSEALHLSLGQGWKNSLGTGDGKRNWRFGHGSFPGGTLLPYHDREAHNTTLRFGLEPLDLGKTAVDKQFHSRDVATVIRCEKHHSPSTTTLSNSRTSAL